LKAEHMFPDIEDPEILFKHYNELRGDWDPGFDTRERLDEFSNENTMVYRSVCNPGLGLTPREFIDKAVHFRRSDL